MKRYKELKSQHKKNQMFEEIQRVDIKKSNQIRAIQDAINAEEPYNVLFHSMYIAYPIRIARDVTSRQWPKK